jgi:hypothetical protein
VLYYECHKEPNKREKGSEKKRRTGDKKKGKRGKREGKFKNFSPQLPAAFDAQLPLGYHSIAMEAFVCSSHGGHSAPAVEKLWLCHWLLPVVDLSWMGDFADSNEFYEKMQF